MENQKGERYTSILCSITSSEMEIEEIDKFLDVLNAYILKIYPRIHTTRYEVDELQTRGKPPILTVDRVWSDKGMV